MKTNKTPSLTLLVPASDSISVPMEGGQGILPKNGAMVELSTYWRRRLSDGDVAVGRKTEEKKKVTK